MALLKVFANGLINILDDKLKQMKDTDAKLDLLFYLHREIGALIYREKGIPFPRRGKQDVGPWQ